MLEIIAMSVEDAISIEECGADRIELVSALTEGGLTPSFGLIDEVIKSVNIPVNVMIRHHAKSFMYSESDISIMLKDIEKVKELGANGIVIGMLDKENNIEENQLKTIISASKGLEITFHRAIDETNLLNSIDVINRYNEITNILTSGGKGKVIDNTDYINTLKNKSKHAKVLLGGGLNFENIEQIKKLTNNKDFHFGTGVRVNKNPFGEIDKVKLKKLVNIIND